VKTEFCEIVAEAFLATAIERRFREHMGVGTLERRKSKRFPIRRKLQLKMLNKRSTILAGNGETLNISSSGLLFTSDCDPPVGSRVELSIDWPVQLDEKCLVKLVAQGRIIRHQSGEFAVKILSHDFRTQAASPTKERGV
jgi:hypothetical protein